ncbi:hypothetical protein [Streptomyces sp. NPDC047985]|uniref:hypothetical protein n=1 Tax=unclassified Streptomyces TaxID=2593676 RepID=UPI00343850F0
MADYVVTEQLAKEFDKALRLVRGAVRKNSSYAAYLHGSFGAGESHFLTVLHAVLNGDPAARAKPRLREVSKVPSGPRRLARRLATLSGSSTYAPYEDAPPPCDAPHQTPRAPPFGRTTLLSRHAPHRLLPLSVRGIRRRTVL